jgi:hypothetical protein
MTDPAATSLTLVGTVHRDRRGASKLARLLAQLRPDEITLEMSPLALSYRRNQGRIQLLRLERILDRLAAELGRDRQTLRAHPAIADIRTLLAPPFEYQAAASYAEEARIPLTLIDLSEASATKLKKVESDLITYRNIRVLVNLPLDDEPPAEEGYLAARAMVLGNPGETLRRAFLEGRRGREGVGPRDGHMARQIRQRLGAHPERHLVHVGGWVHLVEDDRGETLYSLLQDLAPRRILLE